MNYWDMTFKRDFRNAKMASFLKIAKKRGVQSMECKKRGGIKTLVGMRVTYRNVGVIDSEVEGL
ncbi:hypothetical protein [Solitalea koreensis]|uniref:Uncharacterized protein n=1 Tax=Solitalea koreensis TaxID=543615 RepID=A0A521C2L9_9SPHI|nr:hypothetical protein [Solitalea koreensis]SMO53727.1 hypothetical protein SAMN06265350_103157 [Solitalea koreensis]